MDIFIFIMFAVALLIICDLLFDVWTSIGFWILNKILGKDESE
jgi:hypothetical protein